MKMLKIVIDFDDCFAHFNSLAIKLANSEHNYDPPLSESEITSWKNEGRTSIIKDYYNDMRLYMMQANSIEKENIEVVKKLMQIADVYFMTAVYPHFMEQRITLIKSVLPELPTDHIILGSAKYMTVCDIMLDDNIDHILNSTAEFPVLMRRPWNKEMTGCLSVNDMSEFLSLVEHVLKVTTKPAEEVKVPSVFCLVGPTGSGKSHIAEFLSENYSNTFERPITYSTKEGTVHECLTQKEFEKMNFFEKTCYAGEEYGTKKEDIAKILEAGRFPVLPIDICGAIAMKKQFPTVIIYVDRDIKAILNDILARQDNYTNHEAVLRILAATKTEKKNAAICDYVFDNNDGSACYKICQLAKI